MARTHVVEWVGGLVTLPSIVTGEGEPFHPEALVWVETTHGLVVGTEIGRPGTLVEIAALHLVRSAARPLAGPPTPPHRVRVASHELASSLRGKVGDIELVVAPTPELDPVFAAMSGAFMGVPAPTTYFGDRVTPADLAAAFDALARLYRAKPWTVIPADSLVAVTCEAARITDGALCVVGQQGTAYGFSLFASIAAWDAYLDLIDSRAAGLPGTIAAHMMVSYDPRGELPRELIHEIERHGWTVAATNAFPTFQVFDHDGVSRLPDQDELLAITAVTNALVALLGDPTLAAAWDDERPRTATVREPLPATVSAPLFSEVVDDDAIYESFVGFDGTIDVEALDAHREALVEQFLQSPSGRDFEGRWADAFIELAARACHASVLELRPHELRLVLFEVFPESLPVEGEQAREVLDEVRAVLEHAATELGSPHARRCLDALPPDAAERLAKVLDNPTSFGPAKQFLLAGTRAGFDMSTREGIQAYLQTQQDAPAAKARKPAKPAKSAKPAKPAKSAKPAKPAKSAKPAKLAKPPTKPRSR